MNHAVHTPPRATRTINVISDALAELADKRRAREERRLEEAASRIVRAWEVRS